MHKPHLRIAPSVNVCGMNYSVKTRIPIRQFTKYNRNNVMICADESLSKRKLVQ